MYTYDKPDNLVEMFESALINHGDRPFFGTPDEKGEYTWETYSDIGLRINNLRSGLRIHGIVKGDAVGVIANNRSEWAIAAFATFGLKAFFVPMYEKELPKIWKHIIQDSGLKILFVANEEILDEVNKFRSDLPNLEHIFLIDGNTTTTIHDVEREGSKVGSEISYPSPSDIAVLIYTSGTTGAPKGVLLSHGNFTSNVQAGGKKFPNLGHKDRSLSILPWAHSYGQTAELYNFIGFGGSIGFIRNPTTIAEDMGKVAPTFLIAVPRVFNKIYDGLWTKINETGGFAYKLFTMGLESAKEVRECQATGRPSFLPKLKYSLADNVVFKKIRQRFGGRLDAALTASAMMNQDIAQFFIDIGIPVFDAYGLTETTPAVTMNCWTDNRPGSVGKPIEKVRVVIDRELTGEDNRDGEIIVYGPNVMQGYHNRPDATKEVMTEDGGFRTGDLGYLDDDGYLFITGRIKEQYKLENGKYVFPASIEEEIQLIPWIENVLIYGEGKSYNICLVVPDFVKLESWAHRRGIKNTAPHELIKLPEVEVLIKDSISNHLKGKFGGYEIPKKLILLEEPFSVDNGMLTHTLKLKRKKVIDFYGDKVHAAYETA